MLDAREEDDACRFIGAIIEGALRRSGAGRRPDNPRAWRPTDSIHSHSIFPCSEEEVWRLSREYYEEVLCRPTSLAPGKLYVVGIKLIGDHQVG